MGKCISSKKLTDTLTLSECTDGFYLYDKIRGMNISMRAKTEEQAFVATITYYQKMLMISQTQYKNLSEKVESFIGGFINDEGDIEL
jgi:hypothetical protein